jgi:signal transduction histidine kinase/ligand-binding sensor domain-containing protein
MTLSMMAALILADRASASALSLIRHVLQFGHVTWMVRDGSLPGYPRAMVQTPDGFLWVATESALGMFDGNTFTAWVPPAGARLAGAEYATLATSPDGSLWIGTTAGLARLRDGALTEYAELAGQFVVSLAVTDNGTVWAGTNGGQGRATLCAIETRGVRCYGQSGEFGRFILSVLEDRHGQLWVGASNGLWQVNPASPLAGTRTPAPREIHAIIEEDNGILVAANRGLTRREANGEQFVPVGSREIIRPTALLKDRNGGLWIGTQDEGLLRIRNGQVEQLAKANGLSGDFVVSLFEDRDGSLWVGTLNGLDRIRDVAAVRISTDEGLASDTVVSVHRSQDGGVWIGTLRGLNRWRSGVVTRYDGSLGGAGHASVGSLYEDSRRRLWVSSTTGLFLLASGFSGPARRIADTSYVHAITEDTAGTVWISDQQRGLIPLRGDQAGAAIGWAALGGSEARALAADRQGGIWLGFTTGGLAHFQNGQVSRRLDAKDGIAGGRIESLYVDDQGAVWVASQGGVSRVAGTQVDILTPRNGLPCGRALWIVEDANRSLWVNTSCGIVNLSREEFARFASGTDRTSSLRLFEARDGIPSSDLGGYGPKATLAVDGTIWFATYDGAGVLDQRAIPPRPRAPHTIVERVTADRTEFPSSGPLKFERQVRDLQIDYAGVSLSAPEAVVFRYRLDGRDTQWIEAGHRRVAYYTDLPPGDYTFRVEAGTEHGSWSADTAFVAFSIPRAFYQTTSFVVLSTSAAILLLYGLYTVRVRQLAASYRIRLDERLAERSRVAQDLHDTLLQGFISCGIHLQVLVDEIKDASAHARLSAIVNRITKVVEEGRQAVAGLKSGVVDDVSEALAREAALLRGPQATDVRLTVLGVRAALKPIVRDVAYYIGREALANAYRHAMATQVEIEIVYGPSDFRLCVRDDGRGFRSTRAPSDHWGLRGMKERADSIGGTLVVRTRAGHGTEVTLTVTNAEALVGGMPPRWWRALPWRRSESR